MESNTQADDDDDNQINCVIEPFYFIDDFNEFWWRFDAAGTLFTPAAFSLTQRSFSLVSHNRPFPMQTIQPKNSPTGFVTNKRKPRENDRKMFVN